MVSRQSLIEPLRDYFIRIFQDIKNMKALILDEETMTMISMVLSQSEILQHDVFMVETIDNILRSDEAASEKLNHLYGVCVLRPTELNITKLQTMLASPRYGHYYLYFTNKLQPTLLQRLAAADKNDIVKQVFEIFSDYYCVNHDLFSLNIESTLALTKPRREWTSYEPAIVDRVAKGLFSVCLALRRMPVVRFQRSSEVCTVVAERLHELLREDPDLMNSYAARSAGRHKTAIDGVDQTSMVLIIDRREDPVTPLLHQWTYQAMLHELLTITDNRVTLKKEAAEELRNIALSCEQDQFYEENLYSNFGDLAVNINSYVENYQQMRQTTTKVDSIEDMKRFIENYSEFKRMSGNVSKHVTLAYELDHAIKQRKLLDVSEIEQDIACNDNRSEHFRVVMDVLRTPGFNHFDKLKLVLLYALRYERDEKVRQMKESLRADGVKEQQIALVDAIIHYAGSEVRSCDLFSNKSLIAQTRSKLKSALKNVPNMYTQHQPYLSSLLESIGKGKLKEADFPATAAFNARERVTEVIVFVVGGTTYEEAREVGLLNKAAGDTSFILGGTCLHNSRSFLAELTQLVLPG